MIIINCALCKTGKFCLPSFSLKNIEYRCKHSDTEIWLLEGYYNDHHEYYDYSEIVYLPKYIITYTTLHNKSLIKNRSNKILHCQLNKIPLPYSKIEEFIENLMIIS